eukprot:TRINITY_DN10848_c0_g1_i1.p1 TRINITY_DN10848_c0_g1~~TRINITY_DN10848_c0_g1_i1.p1  ORF type:complete len:683 (-),score=131.35 TRINITY_DN10848_c0_g1_i1:15-1865(-)
MMTDPNAPFWKDLLNGDIILAKNNMKRLIHKYGYNIRHIGELRNGCPLSGELSTHVKTLLLREMMLRSIKSVLQEKLKEEFELRCIPIEDIYRRTIIEFYSELKDYHSDIWTSRKGLKKIILSKFSNGITTEEMDRNVNLLDIIGCSKIHNNSEFEIFMNMVPVYSNFVGGTTSNTRILSKTSSILRYEQIETKEMQEVISMRSPSLFWEKRSLLYTYRNDEHLYEFLKTFVLCCKKKGAKFLINYLSLKCKLLLTLWPIDKCLALFDIFLSRLNDEKIEQSKEVMVGVAVLFSLLAKDDPSIIGQYLTKSSGEYVPVQNKFTEPLDFMMEELNKKVSDVLYLGSCLLTGVMNDLSRFNHLDISLISKYLVYRNITSITEISLNSPSLKSLQSIYRLKNIRILSIKSCKLTDWAFEDIHHLENLNSLSIESGGKLSDRFLKYIAPLGNLEKLELTSVPLRNSRSYGYISKLKNMDHIKLDHCSINNSRFGSLYHLIGARVKHLSLRNNTKLTDELCDDYLKFMINLEFLDLSGCSKISDMGIFSLVELNKLSTLRIAETKISMDTLEDLSVLESLVFLDLSGCMNLSESVQRVWRSKTPNVVYHCNLLIKAKTGDV